MTDAGFKHQRFQAKKGFKGKELYTIALVLKIATAAEKKEG